MIPDRGTRRLGDAAATSFAAIVAVLLAPLCALADDPDPQASTESAIQSVVRACEASVVSVRVARKPRPPAADAPETAEEPEAANDVAADYRVWPDAPVTGTIVADDGLILVTRAAISGNVERVVVTLPSGRAADAEILGWSEPLDVALLRVDAEGLIPAAFSEAAEELRVGTPVVRVARGPDPGRPTVAVGIVSALDRFDGAAFQTDAAMNPGAAGGLVAGLDGRVLGLAAHVDPASPWGFNSGVGFATRGSVIRSVMDDLESGKRVRRPPTPYLGVRAAEGADDVAGALVAEVLPDTPAARAGLRENDVIVEFDDATIADWDDLVRAIRARKPGDAAKLRVKRGEETVEFHVELAEK